LSPFALAKKLRNSDCAKYANYNNNNQQFHQREAGLTQLAALLAALQALEQRALGQQLGLETGGHGVSSSVEYMVMIAPPAGAANKGGLSRI
jgi:hypothetical protein